MLSFSSSSYQGLAVTSLRLGVHQSPGLPEAEAGMSPGDVRILDSSMARAADNDRSRKDVFNASPTRLANDEDGTIPGVMAPGCPAIVGVTRLSGWFEEEGMSFSLESERPRGLVGLLKVEFDCDPRILGPASRPWAAVGVVLIIGVDSVEDRVIDKGPSGTIAEGGMVKTQTRGYGLSLLRKG